MDGNRMVGAIAGALVAGIGISALLLRGERASGEPSELAALERTGARRLGLDAGAEGDALPGTGEQALIHGGHLLLSAAAGAVYAASVDDEAPVIASGIGFGLAFYAAMHWIAGPLLGLKRPEWRADGRQIAMHTLNHVAFGLATAAGARAAVRVSGE